MAIVGHGIPWDSLLKGYRYIVGKSVPDLGYFISLPITCGLEYLLLALDCMWPKWLHGKVFAFYVLSLSKRMEATKKKIA